MQALFDELATLATLLSQPDFGRQPARLGTETEFSLIDPTGRPVPQAPAILDNLTDHDAELMRWNTEHQLWPPLQLAGRPFSALSYRLADAARRLKQAAALTQPAAQPILIGILPTLDHHDLVPANITPKPRYLQLNTAVERVYGPHHPIEIGSLRLTGQTLAFQGANTSFQVHHEVAPTNYTNAYNAAQLAAALVLAGSSNAIYLLGHQLWHETRIAIFEQITCGRANFGYDWIQDPVQLFTEIATLHPPLFGQIGSASTAPYDLPNLRLHSGSVWYWNRPVYDPAGSLRIESRYLPAGPTITDMVANAAWLIGLTLALQPHAPEFTRHFPFAKARANFYRAAGRGLGARLAWPSLNQPGRTLVASARQLALESLGPTTTALIQAGVEPAEAQGYLRVIGQRLLSRQTGSTWQATHLVHLREMGLPEANLPSRLVQRYQELSQCGLGPPVHTWPLR